MISINATTILQLLHFLILLFILNRLMFRPMLKLVKDRANHIEKTLQEVENNKNATKELVDKRISLETDVRKKAREEGLQHRKEASSMSEKIFDDTRQEVALIREKIDKEVDGQMETAQQDLQGEAAILADEIIEKLVGRRIEP